MTDNSLQRTPEWFERRKKRITASNVGAILGLDPYRDRNDVMRQMVRDALGAEREFKGNPATEYGIRNEENARMAFEMDMGVDVTPAPFVEYEDWAGASPDGWVSDGSIVEFKCPFGMRNHVNPAFKSIDEQPHYYAQVQFQLYCTGKHGAWFSQWNPNDSSYVFVLPDQDWVDKNISKLKQFYAEFLHELEHNSTDHLSPKRITLDSVEAHKMVREWDDIAEQMAMLDDRKKQLLAEMVRAADDKNADFAGRKLTLVKRAGSVSYANVVKDHCKGVDIELYRGKESASWQLR